MKPNTIIGTLQKPVEGYARRFVSASMDLADTANERLSRIYARNARHTMAEDCDTMASRVESYVASRQPIGSPVELPETATIQYFG